MDVAMDVAMDILPLEKIFGGVSKCPRNIYMRGNSRGLQRGRGARSLDAHHTSHSPCYYHIYSLVPSRFSACNIEKLGMGLRTRLTTIIYAHMHR